MNDPVGSYAERKLTRRIQKLERQFAELEHFVTNPPSVTIYNIQEVITVSSETWEQELQKYLISIDVKESWILNIINPSNTKNPENMIIHFVSHSCKDKAFTIISDYFLEKEIDALVTKDD